MSSLRLDVGEFVRPWGWTCIGEGPVLLLNAEGLFAVAVDASARLSIRPGGERGGGLGLAGQILGGSSRLYRSRFL